jgi:uncharacterized protein (DUF1778 family)
MSSTPTLKSERLAARVTVTQKRLVERAAAAEGISTGDFTVSAAVDRAKAVLADRVVIELADADWEHVSAVLDQPPAPMPGLVQLLRRPPVFRE